MVRRRFPPTPSGSHGHVSDSIQHARHRDRAENEHFLGEGPDTSWTKIHLASHMKDPSEFARRQSPLQSADTFKRACCDVFQSHEPANAGVVDWYPAQERCYRSTFATSKIGNESDSVVSKESSETSLALIRASKDLKVE